MNTQEGPGSTETFADKMRAANPEMVLALENKVHEIESQTRLPGEKAMGNEDVARAVNFAINRIVPQMQNGLTPQEQEKLLEDELWKGLDDRKKLHEEGLAGNKKDFVIKPLEGEERPSA